MVVQFADAFPHSFQASMVSIFWGWLYLLIINTILWRRNSSLWKITILHMGKSIINGMWSLKKHFFIHFLISVSIYIYIYIYMYVYIYIYIYISLSIYIYPHICRKINRKMGLIFSNQDTDKAFGSSGSFFQWPLVEGSYECNPPFEDSGWSRWNSKKWRNQAEKTPSLERSM